MAKKCIITGKSSKMAGGYSNRTRATKFNPIGMRRKKVNLQPKKIFIPELGQAVKVTISTKGLRTLQKQGAFKALKKAGVIA